MFRNTIATVATIATIIIVAVVAAFFVATRLSQPHTSQLTPQDIQDICAEFGAVTNSYEQVVKFNHRLRLRLANELRNDRDANGVYHNLIGLAALYDVQRKIGCR